MFTSGGAASRRTLGRMQACREAILCWRDRIEQHDGADLAAMADIVRDHELASFACVTSIEASAHNAVLHHADMFADGKMDVLIDEGAPGDRMPDGLRRTPDLAALLGRHPVCQESGVKTRTRALQ